MKQVEVTIMGNGYVLGCPEGGEALLAAAVAQVDKEMSAIRDGGKVKARERIAVLAALNLAYRMSELQLPGPGPRRDPGAGSPPPEIDIDALVQRIDSALARDGRLL